MKQHANSKLYQEPDISTPASEKPIARGQIVADLRLDEWIRELVRGEVRAEVARVMSSVPTRPTHISIAEYAAARSISVSTVRSAIKHGRLPALRIGTAVRVPVDVEIGRPANEDTRGSQMPPVMQADQILAKRAVRAALKSEIKRVA